MSARAPLLRGDVVLVHFPFTDLSGSKLRPAIVVGRPSGSDLILAFVTTRVAGSGTGTAPAECPIDPNDPEFRLTGLKAASAVRLDKLATLNRRLVPRRLGHVGPQTELALAQTLRYVFDH